MSVSFALVGACNYQTLKNEAPPALVGQQRKSGAAVHVHQGAGLAGARNRKTIWPDQPLGAPAATWTSAALVPPCRLVREAGLEAQPQRTLPAHAWCNHGQHHTHSHVVVEVVGQVPVAISAARVLGGVDPRTAPQRGRCGWPKRGLMPNAVCSLCAVPCPSRLSDAGTSSAFDPGPQQAAHLGGQTRKVFVLGRCHQAQFVRQARQAAQLGQRHISHL